MSNEQNTPPLQAGDSIMYISGPSQKTLEQRSALAVDASGAWAVLWCPDTLAGCVYSVRSRQWWMRQPIGPDEFLAWLDELDIRLHAHVLQQWMERCEMRRGTRSN